jgi:hypothetical protein
VRILFCKSVGRFLETVHFGPSGALNLEVPPKIMFSRQIMPSMLKFAESGKINWILSKED